LARNLDSSLASALTSNNIIPAILVSLQFKSGTVYVWNGVGDMAFGGVLYKGVGNLGKISPIKEGSSVGAEGVQVTLSGIGASPITPALTPPYPATNPVTVPAGQYVAWSLPGTGGISTTNTSRSGNVVGTSASMTLNGGVAGEAVNQGVSVTWGNFSIPQLPTDAVIQAIYPVVVVDAGSVTDTSTHMYAAGSLIGIAFPNGSSGQYYGASIGTDLSVLETASGGFGMYNSNTSDSVTSVLNIDTVGFAVYYSSANGAPSLIQEAMSDYKLGGSAKVWFGLLQGGGLNFIGSPYLLFSGQVDQPSIELDTNTGTLTIDLENRLTNLFRPTSRRYTTADQHIEYPDDTGFNWVEVLNDIALRWGT
jgi:hypothetical protein